MMVHHHLNPMMMHWKLLVWHRATTLNLCHYHIEFFIFFALIFLLCNFFLIFFSWQRHYTFNINARALVSRKFFHRFYFIEEKFFNLLIPFLGFFFFSLSKSFKHKKSIGYRWGLWCTYLNIYFLPRIFSVIKKNYFINLFRQ